MISGIHNIKENKYTVVVEIIKTFQSLNLLIWSSDRVSKNYINSWVEDDKIWDACSAV